MDILAITDRATWEGIRSRETRMHGYSFGFDWLEFQAHWLDGKRISLALMDGRERVVDVFSGVLLRDKLLAGPESAPGGCLEPAHLSIFLNFLGNRPVWVSLMKPPSIWFDQNYEMIIDLKETRSIEAFFKEQTSRNTRRGYAKAKNQGFEFRNGKLDEFLACYNDLCGRKKIRNPLPKAYFVLLFKTMGEQVILKSVYLNHQLMGSSLLFVTPGHIHAFFILSMADGFRLGLPSLLFADMIEEAFSRKRRYVNLGPSAPWDGAFEFKRRFGATPCSVYASQINTGLLRMICFRLKGMIKEYKGAKVLTLSEI